MNEYWNIHATGFYHSNNILLLRLYFFPPLSFSFFCDLSHVTSYMHDFRVATIFHPAPLCMLFKYLPTTTCCIDNAILKYCNIHIMYTRLKYNASEFNNESLRTVLVWLLSRLVFFSNHLLSSRLNYDEFWCSVKQNHCLKMNFIL